MSNQSQTIWVKIVKIPSIIVTCHQSWFVLLMSNNISFSFIKTLFPSSAKYSKSYATLTKTCGSPPRIRIFDVAVILGVAVNPFWKSATLNSGCCCRNMAYFLLRCESNYMPNEFTTCLRCLWPLKWFLSFRRKWFFFSHTFCCCSPPPAQQMWQYNQSCFHFLPRRIISVLCIQCILYVSRTFCSSNNIAYFWWPLPNYMSEK